MAVEVASADYTWAIIYLIGCAEDPFTKVPIVPNTVLAAQAVVGLKPEERYKNFNGSIANDLRAQYKVYMFCTDDYFTHLDEIESIANAFFVYTRNKLNERIERESAYALCTAIFPPTTTRGKSLQALLTPHEQQYLTKSNVPLADLVPIVFHPRPAISKDVVKCVYKVYINLIHIYVHIYFHLAER